MTLKDCNMKTLCILTATRAEYGLLKTIIEKLMAQNEFRVEVAVTGAHLSEKTGMTYEEIESDGIPIAVKIPILEEDMNSPESVSKAMANAMTGFAKYFASKKIDALMVLGDRYETLAVCLAAMNAQIPILHLYGGETTEGAIDEAIRHSITKLSYLHFTSTEEYRKRVIQLGEDPERVFCVGAIGIENGLREEKMSREELFDSLHLSKEMLTRNLGIVTFHPVTLENDIENQCDEFLAALKDIAQNLDTTLIITGANADCGGDYLNSRLEEFAAERSNVAFVMSLGRKRYLSALNTAEFVLGNSSSGLVEAPTFHIPTINVGNRQKGRLMGDTILCCDCKHEEIVKTVQQALTKEVQEKCQSYTNPYGDGNTSDRIVSRTKEFMKMDQLSLQKKFYDL